MPSRRPKKMMPDLFSASTISSAPAPQAAPQKKIGPPNQILSPRHILPKDLSGSLRRLADAEIDSLLAAVMEEAQRRNRLPLAPRREKERPRPKPQPRPAPSEDGAQFLTKGQVNAVRAAFKAGVRPSAIARQFGISQFVVKRALASEAQDRGR
jgi:hypothetical protein